SEWNLLVSRRDRGSALGELAAKVQGLDELGVAAERQDPADQLVSGGGFDVPLEAAVGHVFGAAAFREARTARKGSDGCGKPQVGVDRLPVVQARYAVRAVAR